MIIRAKNFIAAGIASLVMAWPPTALAEGEMYVVDVQKVISESIIGKAARNDMDSEMKKTSVKLNALKDELSRSREDLAKQKDVLSAEAREQKIKLMKKKERDLEDLFTTEREKLKQKNDQILAKLVEEVWKTVNEIAKEEQYSLVVEKDPRMVVYVNPKFDLTARVLRSLDERKLG